MLIPGLVLGVGLLPYWLLLPERLRRPAFFLLGAALLAWSFPSTFPVLGAVAIGGWFLLGAGGSRSAALVLLGVLFLLWYRAQGAGAAGGAVLGGGLVGGSYFAFRLIHLALERSNDRPTPDGLLAWLEYLLFPPTLLSGPIERFAAFRDGTRLGGLELDDALWGTRRIAAGLAKKLLLVDALGRVARPLMADPATVSTGGAWAGLLAYSFFLYLDFSAYCDLALGVSRLYGFRLAENFDWPYLSADISEFWRRWHITLSTWLRDYLFMPLTGALRGVERLRDRHLLVAVLGSLVTMVACGAWHGAGSGFLVWGLGHGIAVGAHHAYRELVLGKLKARKRRDLQRSRPYRMVATLLTFTVVTLLWIPFAMELPAARVFTLRLLGL